MLPTPYAADFVLPEGSPRLLPNPSCGGISLNSPRAGRQQGQASSVGCTRGLFIPGFIPPSELLRGRRAWGALDGNGAGTYARDRCRTEVCSGSREPGQHSREGVMDENTLQALLAGDEDAFRTAYRDIHPRLLRYLTGLVGVNDAADVAAEAWAHAVRDLQKF